MIDLGTLGGTVGSPNGLNNRGQVVGQSNLAGDSTFHAFLWGRGVLTDLGTLGGNNSTPFGLNDAGEAVGRADLPGSQSHHGFLWKHGVMTDLGTLDGAACTTANAVNSRGQIVGDAGVCFVGGTGWLWEDGGPIVDLNTLAIPGSDIHLAGALQINDRGEIVVEGVLPNGDRHTLLLVPQGECDDACQARIADSQNHPAAIAVRPMTSGLKANQQARFAGKYHVPNPGSPSN
jgi:probable HAF family extracellular repeat protein